MTLCHSATKSYTSLEEALQENYVEDLFFEPNAIFNHKDFNDLVVFLKGKPLSPEDRSSIFKKAVRKVYGHSGYPNWKEDENYDHTIFLSACMFLGYKPTPSEIYDVVFNGHSNFMTPEYVSMTVVETSEKLYAIEMSTGVSDFFGRMYGVTVVDLNLEKPYGMCHRTDLGNSFRMKADANDYIEKLQRTLKGEDADEAARES